MKTVDFTLNGVTYKLCFSLEVLTEMWEESDGAMDILDKINDKNIKNQMTEYFNLAEKFIKGGAKLERKKGREGKEITANELQETCDALDFIDLKAKVMMCLYKGQEPEVKIKNSDSKNAEARAEGK